MRTLDAIVVGAGPAGSFCAYHLARAGWSVMLVEKCRVPREKVCGGALSRKTLDLAGFSLDTVVHHRVSGATLTFRDEMSVQVRLDSVGACTSVRAEFDALLVDQARSAGVDFRDRTRFLAAETSGNRVRVTTDRQTLVARYLLGADGIGSAVRHAVFREAGVRQVPAVEKLLEVPPDVLDHYADNALFDLGGMQRGYGWVFPKRDHLNVGIYSPWGGTALHAQLERFIATHKPLASHRVRARAGFAIPLFDSRRALVSGRTMLLGDAAGFAEGVYGEGIYFAMRSGQLAAEALTGAPDGEAGSRYAGLVARHLAPELRYSNVIGHAYFAFPRFAFRHFAMNARGQRRFAAVLTGETGYRDCFWSALRALPGAVLGPPDRRNARPLVR